MEQKNLVPKRRFKEFQNAPAWEKRKLVDLCTTFTDGDWIEAKDQSDNGIRLIQTGNVGVNEFIDKADKSKWITEDTFNRLNCSEVYPGDILISRLPEPAGRACIVPNFEKRMITAVDCTIVRTSDECNKKYLVQYLSSESYFKSVNNFLAGGTRQRISRSNLANFIVPLPSKPEQKKIGAVLDRLDNLITLHQRKLEKMKALKSAYLSEMFPAEGERVPKRRFAGFTQPWERRKFIELLDVKDGIRRGPFGSALKKDLFVPKSDYVVYEQQNAIYDKWETRYYITKEKFEELHKFVLSEGDFIMSGAGTIGRIAKVPKGIKKGVFNQALIRFKINPELTDSNYFLEWIRSNEMQRKFTGSNPGSAMTNLVPMSEVKEWVISLPSLAEQKKIGDFFAELSDIITLHQRKLEKLQNLKKAYLNEMFV